MRSRHKLVMALLVAVASCARVGPSTPRPEATPLPSSLSGVATLAGQRLRVVVHLVTDADGRGTGHLEIPGLTLTADGSATWRDDTLELDLRYDGACPGELRIRASRTEDGPHVEGSLVAKDCTGEESGSLVLEVPPASSASGRAATRVESTDEGI